MPNPIKIRSQSSAFSLVELLIVVGILGILIAISTAALQSALTSHRLTKAGAQLTALLERARMHATTTQRVVAVRFYAADPAEMEAGFSTIQILEWLPSVPEPATAPITRAFGLDAPIRLSAGHSSGLDPGKNANLVSGTAVVAGQPRAYREFYIFPDGSTSLASQSPNPYFTLVAAPDETELLNPLVVSIDPVTSRLTVFRR